MINAETDTGRLIAAALRLAAARPWDQITLRDIAEEAGVSLAAMREHFSSKAGILKAFTKAADEVVLREAAQRHPVGSTRDAIFEVLMSRFDAMEPYKPALRSIVRTAGQDLPDPDMLRAVLSSQHWMLEAAGVDTSGAGGAVRTLGLASVYASVFRVWLDDSDPGLARTMAALDRRLRRGEQNLKALDSICGVGRRLTELFTRRPSRREEGGSRREGTSSSGGDGGPAPTRPQPPPEAPEPGPA